MNPPSPDNIRVIIDDRAYTLVPETSVDTIKPIDIKQQIAQINSTIGDANNLKKIVGNEMKVVLHLEGKINKRVFTLDDGRKVLFNYTAQLFLVNKTNNNIMIESYDNKNSSLEDGTIFELFDVYVDTTKTKRNVYDATIISGGSRKNHRKSAKRVRISKKSSQSRVRKYRK